MRALGLFLLLVGCLVLLWPLYGHFLHVGVFSRDSTQLYGGAAVLAGLAFLVVSRMAAR